MNIIYEDNYILAVNKGHGELAQGGEGSVAALAEAHTGSACHIITRLDRPVGGIVLLAKDKKTAAQLTSMLQTDSMAKYYYAVVTGQPAKAAHLEHYLMKDSRLNIAKVVNKGNVGAKLAQLDYELTASRDGTSLIKIHLITGRHHQIRAQLAANNTPICGDTKYNKEYKHRHSVTTALFATELRLVHPVTGEMLTLKATPESEFFKPYSHIFS
jgi:23S rRNA pseudouridine1911/1915/1917 synthase